jgi:hypothetical protein
MVILGQIRSLRVSEIIIPLVGGLGNQMFQYAAAKSVAVRCKASLKLDLSWFSQSDDRDYALSPFNITHKVLLASETKPNLLNKIFKRAAHRIGLYSATYGFQEKSFKCDSTIDNVKAPAILNGYFQSEKYFKNIKDTILDEFKLKDAPNENVLVILKLIENYDSICVHVRRGDYVVDEKTNKYHGICSMSYYHSGVALAAQGLENPHCFIFSDDPEWVKDYFKLDLPMTIVDINGPKEAHEDMRLMSACNHYVIANSSFSWWGAWLGRHPKKRVVAPKQWFSDTSIDTSDLIPTTWVQI